MTRHITSSSSQLVQWAPFLNVTRDLASLHSHVASRPSDLKLAGRSDGGNREFLKFLNLAAPIYPIFSPRPTATPEDWPDLHITQWQRDEGPSTKKLQNYSPRLGTVIVEAFSLRKRNSRSCTTKQLKKKYSLLFQWWQNLIMITIVDNDDNNEW